MIELLAFNRKFDDHFDVWSSCIADALQGRHPNRKQHIVARIPALLTQPQGWGMKVRSVWLLHEFISDDLLGYSASHLQDEESQHVCLSHDCRWNHEGVVPVTLSQARGAARQMKPSMHLVVQRYVKPWTEQFQVGLALVLNAGHLAKRTSTSVEKCCEASIFVSNSWNEPFDVFASTLHHALDPDTVVWISGFAMWQGDQPEKGYLDSLGSESPTSDLSAFTFAVAMQHTARVLIVLGHSPDAFNRSWVVFETEIAQRLKKPYDVCLPHTMDVSLWGRLASSIEALDIAKCHASKPEDATSILEYARRFPGGLVTANESIRTLARSAVQRAELLSAATTGDIDFFQTASLAKLSHWTSIRGRSATHIAASHAHVEAVMTILRRTSMAHLDMEDGEGCTPLSVAAERGALAVVLALLTLKANPNKPSRVGLMPLHFASACGHLRSVAALLQGNADIDALGAFQGLGTCSPMMVAAWQGHTSVVRALGHSKADVECRNTVGSSALTAAASRGQADVVADLIRLNAAVEARETFDRTPLMVAIQNGRISSVGLLLAAKAHVTSKAGEHYCMMCEWLDATAANDIRALLINARRRDPEIDNLDSESDTRFSSPPGSSSTSPQPALRGLGLNRDESIPEMTQSAGANARRAVCGESWCGYKPRNHSQPEHT